MRTTIIGLLLVLFFSACDCRYYDRDWRTACDLCRTTPDWVGDVEGWIQNKKWCQPGASCSEGGPLMPPTWSIAHEYVWWSFKHSLVCGR